MFLSTISSNPKKNKLPELKARRWSARDLPIPAQEGWHRWETGRVSSRTYQPSSSLWWRWNEKIVVRSYPRAGLVSRTALQHFLVRTFLTSHSSQMLASIKKAGSLARVGWYNIHAITPHWFLSKWLGCICRTEAFPFHPWIPVCKSPQLSEFYLFSSV